MISYFSSIVSIPCSQIHISAFSFFAFLYFSVLVMFQKVLYRRIAGYNGFRFVSGTRLTLLFFRGNYLGSRLVLQTATHFRQLLLFSVSFTPSRILSIVNKQVLNMLARLLQSFNSLLRRNSFAFSTPSKHNQHEEQPVKRTKHNPNASKDLRGYEQLDELTQAQKASSPIHSTTYQKLTAYWFCQNFIPTSLVKSFSKLIANPKSVIASDSLYLPRIDPNGIALYDSLDTGSPYMIWNKLWTQIGPLTIVCLSPYPTLSVLFYSGAAYAYYVTNWSMMKKLVIKMELLPHTEEIVYQTINAFGYISTKKVKTGDLEHTTMHDQYGEENLSEKSARGLVNRDVVFRNKVTNELLLFDPNGIWSEEGIRHVLVA